MAKKNTKKISLTQVEVQDLIGKKMIALEEAEIGESRHIALEDLRAHTTAACQFINGNRFILDAEKHLAQIGSLKKSVMPDLIGEL